MSATERSSQGVAVRADGTASAEALLKTAQRLFAEKGIDAVSMREIAREAGQRNNSALHYYFGSKEALIQAIMQNAMREAGAKRDAYVERLTKEGRQTDLRALIEALVWPMASRQLSGRGDTYNRFLAAAQVHPDIDVFASSQEEEADSFRRVYKLLQLALSDMPEQLLRQRYLSAISFIMFSLGQFERLNTQRRKRSRSFNVNHAIENLIDMVAGALSAPISPQVQAGLPPDGQRR